MLSSLVPTEVGHKNAASPGTDPSDIVEPCDPPSPGLTESEVCDDSDDLPEHPIDKVIDIDESTVYQLRKGKEGSPQTSTGNGQHSIFSYNQLKSCPPRFAYLGGITPPNHHFLAESESRASRSWFKQIRKEYDILESSLPPGIFVRSWESRIDLFRVLILGPEGTPCEYAPFVFDFVFPRKYPDVPPLAFFHSWTNGRGPVNPNLYEEGLVCFSILGTWGSDWSPGNSTVLQILVSIMGLVLVKEPFYNEPGYEKLIAKHLPESLEYSERVFLLSRGFIKYALLNPVPGLEDVTAWNYLPGPAEDGETRPRLLDVSINSATAMIEHYNKTSDVQIDENNQVAPYILRLSRRAVVTLRKHFNSTVPKAIQPKADSKST